MSLSYLINKPDASMEEIAEYLDHLSHEHRLHETMELGRKEQATLWDRAAASPPLTLEHFVPRDKPDLVEIIHHGKNSLPVFSNFQKRFCRPEGDSDKLFGYNEGVTRPMIGPGYFVVYSTADDPQWADRGAVVVDYYQVPEAPVVAGWPKIVPNSKGGQRFVFNRTRDFMRRVSSHVSIGRAYKEDRQMPAFFVLCRQYE